VLSGEEEVPPTAQPVTVTTNSEVTSTASITESATVTATAASTTTASASDDGITGRVAMTGSRLNIRSGPGTNYAIIGKALPNERYVVLARNADSTWVQLESSKLPDGFGWVSVQFIELSQALSTLPVSDKTSSQPQPTRQPTPTATAVSNKSEASPTPTAAENAASEASATATPVPATPVPATPTPAPQSTGPTGLTGKLVLQTTSGGTIYLYN